MKDTIRIAIIILIVFAAGLAAGVWTQRLHPLPPPPAPPLGEFRQQSGQQPPRQDGPAPRQERGPERFPISPEKAAELEQAAQRLRPQIEAFEKKLREIEEGFRAKFEAILSAEQKTKFEQRPPTPQFPGPQGGPGPRDRMSDSFGGLASFTIITPALEHFGKELDLSADQKAQLKNLLVAKRQAFLDFIDANPPPTLELGRMLRPPPSDMARQQPPQGQRQKQVPAGESRPPRGAGQPPEPQQGPDQPRRPQQGGVGGGENPPPGIPHDQPGS